MSQVAINHTLRSYIKQDRHRIEDIVKGVVRKEVRVLKKPTDRLAPQDRRCAMPAYDRQAPCEVLYGLRWKIRFALCASFRCQRPDALLEDVMSMFITYAC